MNNIFFFYTEDNVIHLFKLYITAEGLNRDLSGYQRMR